MIGVYYIYTICIYMCVRAGLQEISKGPRGPLQFRKFVNNLRHTNRLGGVHKAKKTWSPEIVKSGLMLWLFTERISESSGAPLTTASNWKKNVTFRYFTHGICGPSLGSQTRQPYAPPGLAQETPCKDIACGCSDLCLSFL